MQSGTPLSTRTMQPAPARSKNSVGLIVGYVLLGGFICVLLVAVAGLGYWAYSADNKLTATQQQLATLQGQYDTLKSNESQMAATLEQAQVDLKKAQGDLATAQADLSQAKSQTSSLQAKIDKASKYLNIFVGFWGDTYSQSESKIRVTNDSQILSLYQRYENSTTNQDFYTFFDAVVAAIVNSLK